MVSSLRVRLGRHQPKNSANSLAWDRQRSRLIPLSPWPATAVICDPRPSQRHRQNHACHHCILRPPPHGGAVFPNALGRSSLAAGHSIKSNDPNAPVGQSRTSHHHVDLAARKPDASWVGCRKWSKCRFSACGVKSSFE